jgi:hypothetical protein
MSELKLYNYRRIYEMTGVTDKHLSVPFAKAAD